MKHRAALTCLLFLLLGLPIAATAQDDLMDLLEEQEEEVTDYATATFKTTRVINGHSVETVHKGVLQFMIAHRFGRVNGGLDEFFGLDNANIRLGFAYGILDDLTIGIGRSSFEKTYDGYIKYKLLKQSSGKRSMPLTVTLFSSIAIKGLAFPDPERENFGSSRLYYTFQILAARKFTKNLSLQIAPTLVHRNLVQTTADKNDVFSIGFGGRYKVTGSLSINAEYFWVLPNQIESRLYGEMVQDAAAIGIDLETGGHVFQLMLTNSRSMIEKMFVTETTGDVADGEIHIGFNISRVFTLVNEMERARKKLERQQKRAEKIRDQS